MTPQEARQIETESNKLWDEGWHARYPDDEPLILYKWGTEEKIEVRPEIYFLIRGMIYGMGYKAQQELKKAW